MNRLERGNYPARQAILQVCLQTKAPSRACRVTKFGGWRSALEMYENEVIPELQRALSGMEELFESAEVDALHVSDVRRKLIQASDGALDARWEVSDALAELAAAVGDPALPICVPAEPVGPATPAP